MSEINTDEANTLDLAFLDTVIQGCGSCWTTKIQLCGKETTFKIGTGAEVTAISNHTYETLTEKPHLGVTSISVWTIPDTTHSASASSIQGTCSLYSTAMQDIYLVQGLKSDVLGLPAVRALNLVNVWTQPCPQQTMGRGSRSSFKHCFKD